MFVIAYNILFFLIAWILGQCIYNIFFHPLRHIPGPLLAKVSRCWLFSLEIRGTQHLKIHSLHLKYGMLNLCLPNEYRQLTSEDQDQ